jgi:hypothetical protein
VIRRPISSAAVLVAALTAICACGLPGDPGWSLVIQNESAREAIVAIDEATGRRVVYTVAPGTAGFAYGTLGTGRRQVLLLDVGCAVLQAIDTPKAGQLKLIVAADGHGAVGPTEESGLAHLSPQPICGADGT